MSKRLFDTTNPDNELGPLITAVIISILVALIFGSLGLASHHWQW